MFQTKRVHELHRHISTVTAPCTKNQFIINKSSSNKHYAVMLFKNNIASLSWMNNFVPNVELENKTKVIIIQKYFVIPWIPLNFYCTAPHLAWNRDLFKSLLSWVKIIWHSSTINKNKLEWHEKWKLRLQEIFVLKKMCLRNEKKNHTNTEVEFSIPCICTSLPKKAFKKWDLFQCEEVKVFISFYCRHRSLEITGNVVGFPSHKVSNWLQKF